MFQLQEKNRSLYLVALAIFLSRIPFLFSGFGSEEDAYGLILTARNISLTGLYEVSRMPGHPLQELLLAMLWELPPWVLNLMTATVSTTGVLFFMFTLRLWNIRSVIPSGVALAFVPVFYINSTNLMDYTWTLSLVLVAMYFVAKRKIVVAAILLGMACGFRITAGAMVVAFGVLIYFQDRTIRQIVLLGIVTTTVAIICFIPVYATYGTSFFTYYEYFPYPPFLKNIYKASIGAWGVIGCVAVAVAVAVSFFSWRKMEVVGKNKKIPLIIMSTLTIVLYTYSFSKIPQKSAFVLPMVPFIIILFALLLSRKMMWAFALAMVFSCFLLGINLDDPLRGSKASSLAFRTTIGNTAVAIDPLTGMVTADLTKRAQKIKYAKDVVKKLAAINTKTVIIAGWWQNELNYFSLKNKNPLVTYVYYSDEKELLEFKNNGSQIYFLPEQDFYNDLRFKGAFTNTVAEPF